MNGGWGGSREIEHVPVSGLNRDVPVLLTVADEEMRDWRYEVANGDTTLGLDDWRAHQDEAAGMPAPSTPPTGSVRDSLDAILSYMWQEELADYYAEDRPEGHVFEHMLRVSRWSNGEPQQEPVRAHGRIIGFIVRLRRGSYFAQSKVVDPRHCHEQSGYTDAKGDA
jgi:hypothetical protein